MRVDIRNISFQHSVAWYEGELFGGFAYDFGADAENLKTHFQQGIRTSKRDFIDKFHQPGMVVLTSFPSSDDGEIDEVTFFYEGEPANGIYCELNNGRVSLELVFSNGHYELKRQFAEDGSLNSLEYYGPLLYVSYCRKLGNGLKSIAISFPKGMGAATFTFDHEDRISGLRSWPKLRLPSSALIREYAADIGWLIDDEVELSSKFKAQLIEVGALEKVSQMVSIINAKPQAACDASNDPQL